MKWLVPVDGSELSVEAVAYALRLAAGGLKLQLVLANVQEPATVYELLTLHDREAVEQVVQGAGRDQLAPAVALAEGAGVPFEAVVLHGDPVPTLLEVLEAHGCDAVVMGSHGHGAVERALLGSVSQAMLEASPVPVTFVKPPPEIDVD